jgi:lipoyl synthase
MKTPAYITQQLREKANKRRYQHQDVPGNINTVCLSAKCPNRGECFEKKQLTFLILGNICTRACRYCAIPSGKPGPVEQKEIDDIVQYIGQFSLEYVVITSVTRDDLKDGGSSHFANLLSTIHQKHPATKIEVLTPDFMFNTEQLDRVLDATPFVFNHNVETVARLFKSVRPKGDHAKSLSLLRYAKKTYPDIKTKTGIMVGVGETKAEVLELIDQAKDHHIDIVTIGQYLAPSSSHFKVERYVSEAEFDDYARYGKETGVKVVSGALVRSSYNAYQYV